TRHRITHGTWVNIDITSRVSGKRRGEPGPVPIIEYEPDRSSPLPEEHLRECETGLTAAQLVVMSDGPSTTTVPTTTTTSSTRPGKGSRPCGEETCDHDHRARSSLPVSSVRRGVIPA